MRIILLHVSNDTYMLVVYTLLVLMATCMGDIKRCIARDACSCELDGRGMITLRPLDLSNSIKFDLKDHSNPDYKIYYNPCTPFSEGIYCSHTLACEYKTDHSVEYALADPLTEIFSVGADDNVVFTYSQKGQDDKMRKLIVNLICDKSANTPNVSDVTEGNEGSIINYSFSLMTKCACPGLCNINDPPADKSLSVGSILVILFFVLILVYFIGGFVFLKFYKKNEGTDTIPHFEFWTDLPSKIKNGFLDIFSSNKDFHLKFSGSVHHTIGNAYTDGFKFTWSNFSKDRSEYEEI